MAMINFTRKVHGIPIRRYIRIVRSDCPNLVEVYVAAIRQEMIGRPKIEMSRKA